MKRVGATAFGGPHDPGTGHIGASGADLNKHPWSFAELSRGYHTWDALGKLPMGTRLLVRNPATGKSAVLVKRDVGQGGSPIPGVGARKIDIWHSAADYLGFNGWGALEIAPAPKGAKPGPYTGPGASGKLGARKTLGRGGAGRPGRLGTATQALPDVPNVQLPKITRAPYVHMGVPTQGVPAGELPAAPGQAGAEQRFSRYKREQPAYQRDVANLAKALTPPPPEVVPLGGGGIGGGGKGPKVPKDVAGTPQAILALLHATQVVSKKSAGYSKATARGPLRSVSPASMLDCSLSVAKVLQMAHLGYGGADTAPVSGTMAQSWGKPGRGKYLTMWASDGHVFLEFKINGRYYRFDTSSWGAADSRSGPRLRNTTRSTAGFVPRHWPGL